MRQPPNVPPGLRRARFVSPSPNTRNEFHAVADEGESTVYTDPHLLYRLHAERERDLILAAQQYRLAKAAIPATPPHPQAHRRPHTLQQLLTRLLRRTTSTA